MEPNQAVKFTVVQIAVPSDAMLNIQQAATQRRMLLPDFIEAVVKQATAEILGKEDAVKDEDFRQTHRRGRREGENDRLDVSVKVLREAGHQEAADFLVQQFDPRNNQKNPNAASPGPMSHDTAMAADQAADRKGSPEKARW